MRFRKRSKPLWLLQWAYLSAWGRGCLSLIAALYKVRAMVTCASYERNVTGVLFGPYMLLIRGVRQYS